MRLRRKKSRGPSMGILHGTLRRAVRSRSGPRSRNQTHRPRNRSCTASDNSAPAEDKDLVSLDSEACTVTAENGIMTSSEVVCGIQDVESVVCVPAAIKDNNVVPGARSEAGELEASIEDHISLRDKGSTSDQSTSQDVQQSAFSEENESVETPIFDVLALNDLCAIYGLRFLEELQSDSELDAEKATGHKLCATFLPDIPIKLEEYLSNDIQVAETLDDISCYCHPENFISSPTIVTGTDKLIEIIDSCNQEKELSEYCQNYYNGQIEPAETALHIYDGSSGLSPAFDPALSRSFIFDRIKSISNLCTECLSITGMPCLSSPTASGLNLFSLSDILQTRSDYNVGFAFYPETSSPSCQSNHYILGDCNQRSLQVINNLHSLNFGANHGKVVAHAGSAEIVTGRPCVSEVQSQVANFFPETVKFSQCAPWAYSQILEFLRGQPTGSNPEANLKDRFTTKDRELQQTQNVAAILEQSTKNMQLQLTYHNNNAKHIKMLYTNSPISGNASRTIVEKSQSLTLDEERDILHDEGLPPDGEFICEAKRARLETTMTSEISPSQRRSCAFLNDSRSIGCDSGMFVSSSFDTPKHSMQTLHCATDEPLPKLDDGSLVNGFTIPSSCQEAAEAIREVKDFFSGGVTTRGRKRQLKFILPDCPASLQYCLCRKIYMAVSEVSHSNIEMLRKHLDSITIPEYSQARTVKVMNRLTLRRYKSNDTPDFPQPANDLGGGIPARILHFIELGVAPWQWKSRSVFPEVISDRCIPREIREECIRIHGWCPSSYDKLYCFEGHSRYLFNFNMLGCWECMRKHFDFMYKWFSKKNLIGIPY